MVLILTKISVFFIVAVFVGAILYVRRRQQRVEKQREDTKKRESLTKKEKRTYSESPYSYSDYYSEVSRPSSAVSPFYYIPLGADSERGLPFSGSSEIESTALSASFHRLRDGITRSVSGTHFGLFDDTIRCHEKRHYQRVTRSTPLKNILRGCFSSTTTLAIPRTTRGIRPHGPGSWQVGVRVSSDPRGSLKVDIDLSIPTFKFPACSKCSLFDVFLAVLHA